MTISLECCGSDDQLVFIFVRSIQLNTFENALAQSNIGKKPFAVIRTS